MSMVSLRSMCRAAWVLGVVDDYGTQVTLAGSVLDVVVVEEAWVTPELTG